MKRILLKSNISQVENHNCMSVLKKETVACEKEASGMQFLPILIMVLLFGYNHSIAEAQTTQSLHDSILSQNATPTLSDSTILTDSKLTDTTTTSNYYFAIGRGGSYGGIGLKVGKYKVENNRLQASYIIGGLGAYANETETVFGLGILASYGRKYYFPDIFFIDGRAGIQEYAYRSGFFLPVPGVKLIAGIEVRSRRVGVSIAAGISQNLLFVYSTQPVIELGFMFGNFNFLSPKKERKPVN
jgi:hypothetical protein